MKRILLPSLFFVGLALPVMGQPCTVGRTCPVPTATPAAEGLSTIETGDGSDGAINVNASGFDLPATGAVTAWQATHAYVRGDLVKSTGTNVRVYECVRPGTSSGSDPFDDVAPGYRLRGYPYEDGDVVWAQKTLLIDNVLEDNVYATSFVVAVGATVYDYGYIIRAQESIAINGALSGDGLSPDEFGNTRGAPPYAAGINNTNLGQGTDIEGQMASPGGMSGGTGGSGADGAGGLGGFFRPDSKWVSQRHRTIDGILLGAQTALAEGHPSIGGVGGAGAADTGAGKIGGNGGGAGSGVGLVSPIITIGESGLVTVDGGVGADGQSGGDTGGGGGGSAGYVIAVAETFVNWISGTNVTANGGVGGTGQGTGTDGGAGADGEVIQITVE